MKLKLFVFLLFLSACIREVPFPEKSTPSKLVVGCLFGQDSLFKVHISKTQGVFDTSANYVDNAQVELWLDNNKLENLTFIEKGLYKSTIRANSGKFYTLKVSAKGFIPVEASEMIPEKQRIIDARLNINSGWSYEHLSKYNTIDFSFENNGEKDLFFENLLVFNSWVYADVVYPAGNYEDTVLYNSIVPFIESNEVFIQAENYNFDAVTFINSLVFTNELVPDSKINMLLKFYKSNCVIGTQVHLILYLKSISKNYYLYKKSLRKHMENQGIIDPVSLEDYSELLFTGNPINVYSNVKNGYGIFAGYSVDTLAFSVKQDKFQ